jgi:hypothetical protein
LANSFDCALPHHQQHFFFFFVKVENKKKGIKKSFDYSGRDYDRE